MGYGGCEPRIEGIIQWTKRYCTILRKLKNCGAGEGQYLNPKHSLCIKKKEQKKVNKNVTEPGLDPSGLEKPALLSTRLNTIIGITKYEGENSNIQTAIIQKKTYDFFLSFHQIIFSLYSTS